MLQIPAFFPYTALRSAQKFPQEAGAVVSITMFGFFTWVLLKEKHRGQHWGHADPRVKPQFHFLELL